MADADPQTRPTAAQAAPAEQSPRPRRTRMVLMLAIPLLILIAGVIYWQSLQGKVSTDNAYVHVDKVTVSAQVGGKIVEIMVRENQTVRAGDLLFRVDPEP